MGLVKCPGCCQSFHETTDKFNPDVQPNGSMVRLRDPWRKWGWSPFGDVDSRDIKFAETLCTLVSDMICPGCGSPLAPSGRLTIISEEKREKEEEDEISDFIGETIDEAFKTPQTKKELVASMVAEGKPWKEMLKESGLSFKELSGMVKEVQGNV